jgi:hypothetical protein
VRKKSGETASHGLFLTLTEQQLNFKHASKKAQPQGYHNPKKSPDRENAIKLAMQETRKKSSDSQKALLTSNYPFSFAQKPTKSNTFKQPRENNPIQSCTINLKQFD